MLILLQQWLPPELVLDVYSFKKKIDHNILPTFTQAALSPLACPGL